MNIQHQESAHAERTLPTRNKEPGTRNLRVLNCIRQLDADMAEIRRGDPAALLSDKLAYWFAAQLVAAAKLAEDAGTGCIDPKTLSSMNAELAVIRRCDHAAARIKVNQARLKFQQEKDVRDRAGYRKWSRSQQEAPPAKPAAHPRDNNAQTIDALGRTMFGDLWDMEQKLET